MKRRRRRCAGAAWRAGQPFAAAQQAPDAGDQDGQVEGLGEVIVGAGGEALQNVVGMAARGQHQGGNELAGLPHFGHDGEAVLAGQHDVQHHDVERRRRLRRRDSSSSAASPVSTTST